MDPDKGILVTLKERRPHPIYQVQLHRFGALSPPLAPHRFADFVLLKDEVLAELLATPSLWVPEFPLRYFRSKLGVGLSTSMLDQRVADLDAWMKCLVGGIDDLSAAAQAALTAFLGGTLNSTLRPSRVAAAESTDNNDEDKFFSDPCSPTPSPAKPALPEEHTTRSDALTRHLEIAEGSALLSAAAALSLTREQQERLEDLFRRLAIAEGGVKAWTSEGSVLVDRE